MSAIPSTNTLAAHTAGAGLSSGLTLLLATGAGLSVASLYYSQPMLGVLGADIGASNQAMGLVPTLTQLGYAAGILFTAPLGDRHDRRTLILIKVVLLVVALLAAAVSPSVAPLLAASLAIGVAATLAQDIVPAAATLAPDAQRGRVVGTVMTGLLLGILLSRVISGFTAEHLGWRAMFFSAAVATGLLGLALWRFLPAFKPTTTLAYGALLGSMRHLWSLHRSVRYAALAQGTLATGFGAVWSTLALWLHGEPFHLGAAAAGAFGLAGAAGALAAPVFGRLADRHGAQPITLLGAGVAAVSFASMAAIPWLPANLQLWWLAGSVIGFDLGFQGSLIAHQTIIYGADPGARSRLNALLFVAMFTGMALGAAVGSALFAQWGWAGVTALATASSLAALALRWRAARA
ncbi:MFS transporter [Hydrogenophaga sp. IBVHS1]|uniref:MFS transporter n=1 Tax=unclassified Hydrogenophaga TaxID=2610897 RepID=UPI000A2D1FEB|nr:MFS transporter [Hydrogenophaga sp. IBVHS1]OSZ74207.1 MFS transporter [Hydrogenophaga sp. IBVHS1]